MSGWPKKSPEPHQVKPVITSMGDGYPVFAIEKVGNVRVTAQTLRWNETCYFQSGWRKGWIPLILITTDGFITNPSDNGGWISLRENQCRHLWWFLNFWPWDSWNSAHFSSPIACIFYSRDKKSRSAWKKIVTHVTLLMRNPPKMEK